MSLPVCKRTAPQWLALGYFMGAPTIGISPRLIKWKFFITIALSSGISMALPMITVHRKPTVEVRWCLIFQLAKKTMAPTKVAIYPYAASARAQRRAARTRMGWRGRCSITPRTMSCSSATAHVGSP